MHQFVQITDAQQTPYITENGYQKVIISLKSVRRGMDLWGRITLEKEKPYTVYIGRIALGYSKKTISVPDTNKLLRPGETCSLKIELYKNQYCSGKCLCVYENKSWKRSRHWEFYWSQTMHTDLGYTDYPETLRPLYTSYVDSVKKYIADSYNRIEDKEKYKYAIESSWGFREGYAKEKRADEIEDFADFVKKGDLAVAAGRFNNATENCGTEELARSPYLTNRYLKDRYDLPEDHTIRMFDNPAITKSYVDILNSAGIKYAIHSMNPDRSPYHKVRQYDLFYMTGFNRDNKILVFNGKTYGDNYGFGGTYPNGKGSTELAEREILKLIRTLEQRTGRRAYPYDKFPMPLIPFGDNKPPLEKQIRIVNDLNEKWHSQGYAYPKIISAFPEKFFEDIEREYSHLIPIETGTEENWWNDGWGTTAYESGINKKNGTLVPVAETMASVASLCCGASYPTDDLCDASDRASVYNEHTWGYFAYKKCDAYYQQNEWKRSNALGAHALARKTIHNTLKILAKNAAQNGSSIYVYNPLSWNRTDVVTVRPEDDILPEKFEIISDGESLPYELSGNELSFIAKNVPALGYKLYSVVPVDKTPDFISEAKIYGNCVETPFYKLLMCDDGTVASIIDKRNGNREVVDGSADVKWNQYQYYDDFAIPFQNMGAKFSSWKWNLYQPLKENTKIRLKTTALGAEIVVDTGTFRSGSIRQTIKLYDDIERIDIENKVLKSALPQLVCKEEAFYTFPFNAEKGYEIRYDLPIGNVAEGEQIYGTSRDWYTANKWVNVYDKSDDYSMTLSLVNTSLLQFGERRTGKWSFDYKSEKPYIFSYIMNNMWQTNFQGDQPGAADFSYSLFTGKGKSVSWINRVSWERCAPLQAVFIKKAAANMDGRVSEKSYISINRPNVLLSTMKPAESNGDGMIVRFNETAGEETQNIKVRFCEDIESYIETDIIENDIGKETENNEITFSLKPYEIKTFRIKTKKDVSKAEDVSAVCIDVRLPRCEHYQKDRVKELTDNRTERQGVIVSWKHAKNAVLYEVYRVKDGRMFFVGSTKHNALFDCQVTKEICESYKYCVRSVGAGRKSEFSESVTPQKGTLHDSEIFEKPVLYAVPREKNRIDLFWTPVHGSVPVSHYEIYRDGNLIAKTPDDYVTSFRDNGVHFDNRYVYHIVAVDVHGSRLKSDDVSVDHTDKYFENQDSALARKSKRRFLNFI